MRYTSRARLADHFDSRGKQATREHNLCVARTAAGLWTPETNGSGSLKFNRLRCDWAELAGDTIHHTISILENAGAMRPGGFVGIDTDERRIEEYKRRRPDLKWIAGDIRNQVSWLCQNSEIGVLVFDGYLEVGTSEARAFFTTIRPLVQRGIRLFGAFVLFSNNCLDSVVRHPRHPVHRGDRVRALRIHTDGVIEELADYFPRRVLRPSDILPRGFEARVNDGRYEGPLGGYRIYAGTKQNLRMIELGLVL